MPKSILKNVDAPEEVNLRIVPEVAPTIAPEEVNLRIVPEVAPAKEEKKDFSMYKISTLSGRPCIPCAFFGTSGEIYTPSEARLHLSDQIPNDFDFGADAT